MCLICYAIALVGSIIAIYGLAVFGWCKYQEWLSRTMLRVRGLGAISLQPYVYSTFEYQKGVDVMIHVCVVCLSSFEDGEEVRLLPQCKHSFHGPCIDMWLYSHVQMYSNCPMCRSPVEKRVSFGEKENTREVLHISKST